MVPNHPRTAISSESRVSDAELSGLDRATEALVAFAGAIAVGTPALLESAVAGAVEATVSSAWVDELLLQSVLMVGYPRAMVAAGMWRTATGISAPATDADASYDRAEEWNRRGEVTCAIVYGKNYERLRRNIQALHPALDIWMVAEGYGRTLSRAGLDLRRRELCIMVQTAVLDTPRQLHSHLRGALHGGASPAEIGAALRVIEPLLLPEVRQRVFDLWNKLRADGNRGAAS